MTGMEPALEKSPLYERHVAAEARMGEEDGWVVPMSYSGVLEEAARIRRTAAVFDLSHLGRIRLRGNGALSLLRRVCTADVVRQEDDTALHTLLCTPHGGVIEECLLLRLAESWVLTCGPGNRRKVLSHLAAQNVPDVRIDDQTGKVGQLAVVGPAAKEILRRILPVSLEGLTAGRVKTGSWMIADYLALRTAGLGVWGLEVMIPAMFLPRAWDYLMRQEDLVPAGMAAWDVLRVEAARCRYGQELHEAVDPISAGLQGCVDFGRDFLGAAALRAVAEKGPARRRVWLLRAETGPGNGTPPALRLPRMGTRLLDPAGREVGAFTSATFSPHYQRAAAMAYVASDVAEGAATLREDDGTAWRVEKVLGRVSS